MASDLKFESKRLKTGLPPIQKHPDYNKDPYENSFLLKFDLKKKQEDKLRNIM